MPPDQATSRNVSRAIREINGFEWEGDFKPMAGGALKGVAVDVSHQVRNDWITESETAINKRGNLPTDNMAKPSRWTAEKRYQIVIEALSQMESVGRIARRHETSEGLLYRWSDKFYTKAAKPRWLYFKGRGGSSRKKAVVERKMEELQKLISEQAVEISFLKRLSRGQGRAGRK